MVRVAVRNVSVGLGARSVEYTSTG